MYGCWFEGTLREGVGCTWLDTWRLASLRQTLTYRCEWRRPCARSQEASGRCAGKPTHLMTARFNCHFQCRHWRSTVASCTMSRLNKEEPWPPFPIYTGHICDCCRYNRSPRPHTSKATQHGGICARVRSADDVGGRAGGGDRDRVDDDGHCRPGSPQPTPSRSAVLR